MEYWFGTHGYSCGTARVLACTAAARPTAARAVLSCAGAYVSGAAGSNACPAGSVWIVTEAACRIAAAATGKTVGSPFVATDAAYPRGCYCSTVYSNYAYFNAHAVGAGHSTAQLLCAAVTTGALPPRTEYAKLLYVLAGSACWTQRELHGSVGYTRVWFVWYGNVEYSWELRGTHAYTRGLCSGRSGLETSGRGRVTQRRAVCGTTGYSLLRRVGPAAVLFYSQRTPE